MKKLLFYVAVMLTVFASSETAQSQINYDGTQEYGRIYDITFHPTIENKLYALTQGNHIIQSEDKGESWEVIYSYQESTVLLSGLRILSENTLTFSTRFSGTMTNNAVFFFNTDTGETTRQYTPPITQDSDKVWIASYAIYKDDPNVALLHQGYKIGLVNYAKVYYTIDAGTTWALVYYNEDYDAVFPNNVAISPDNPQKLFIARGNGPYEIDGGLFISEDAGVIWEEKLPGNTYGPITFHPQNPQTILLGTDIGYNAHEENLYRSTDGGDSWNIIPITWDDVTLDNIVSIVYDPQDPNTSILLEENEIVITHDDWNTWENYVHPISNPNGYYYGLNASYNPFQTDEVFINANYHPLFSQDGGETFSQLFNPFYPVTVTEIQEGTETHLYYGVQRGLIHRNLTTGSEEGYGIQPLNLIFGGSPPVYYADEITDGRIYKYESTFAGSSLYVSDDYGQDYSLIYSNFNDKLITLTTDPNNINVIWVTFLNEGAKIIDFNDLNNVQVAPVALPEQDILTSTYIEEADSNIVFITVGAHVYKSLDGGITWEEKSNGLEINPTTDIIFDIEKSPFNTEEFTITASNGIYKTIDYAESWTQTFQAENVRMVNYSAINQNHAIASIHSRGTTHAQIVYTTDGGTEWEEVPIETIAYTGSASMAFQFHEESVDAYLATYDLGLVKYTVDLTVLETPDLTTNSNPFIVYPNPASSTINIQENGSTLVSVVIYNSLGQEVMKTSSEKQINISQLNHGVYFVKIKDAVGNYFIKRIVKK